VWLFGDVDHGDFAEAVALVRATANVGPGPPEVIVLAQSRPGAIRAREVERLRRSAPLAGVVSLLGSWCEGETRTGRPPAGVRRLYWYEFPNWWRRQISLRTAGRCPQWARVEDFGWRMADGGLKLGRVAVSAESWETVAAIGNALSSSGAECVWCRSQLMDQSEQKFAAGLWVGGQLSEEESKRLARFCSHMAETDAPVVALLDFPRRDRIVIARQAGAAAVLGKPWLNVDLVTTLKYAVERSNVENLRPISDAA
jgi:hypothetical protein